jgi:hypothetical protein
MDKNIPTTQPTLEEVRDKLEHWRKIKRNHREPFQKISGRLQQILPESIQ